MKKPQPRAEFVSEADEQEHILNCLCWLQAERMSLDLDIPQEICAEQIKEYIQNGRLRVEFDEKRDRVRVFPTALLKTLRNAS